MHHQIQLIPVSCQMRRSCFEVGCRVGAQLELMLEFDSEGATCLLSGERLRTEFTILKHLQTECSGELQNLKSVLGLASNQTVYTNISKAVKSEFLYQQKKVFPIAIL